MQNSTSKRIDFKAIGYGVLAHMVGMMTLVGMLVVFASMLPMPLHQATKSLEFRWFGMICTMLLSIAVGYAIGFKSRYAPVFNALVYGGILLFMTLPSYPDRDYGGVYMKAFIDIVLIISLLPLLSLGAQKAYMQRKVKA